MNHGLPSATLPPTKTLLAVEPAIHLFGKGQEAEFATFLATQSRNTKLLPIDRVEQVLLRADGTFENGYRPTTATLYQMSRSACTGLYRVIIELMADGSEANQRVAVNIFNQVMRLNFHKMFQGRQFMLDHSRQQVDAFLSTSYQIFPNNELYELVRDALVGRGTFFEASVNGRWMLVRYYEKASKFVVPATGESFFSGFSFSNHEGGMAALRGSGLYIRAPERLCFVVPTSSSTRIYHRGERFREKFGRLMTNVLAHSTDRVAFSAGVDTIFRQSLGIGLDLQELEEKREKAIIRQLLRWGVGGSVGLRIIANVLVQSWQDREPVSLYAISNETLRKRTVYDFALSLSRVARDFSISQREELEGMAYLLAMLKTRLR